MYTYLRSNEEYEVLYDKLTVDHARHNEQHYEKARVDLEAKIPKKEQPKPGHAFALNLMYMSLVGFELVDRYYKRSTTIQEWMDRDQAKDDQLANARLSTEPKCQHCGKAGLRIIDKSLMHRGTDYNFDDPEEVLFMLKCPACEKNTAIWEDGSEWEHRHTYCPKCQTIIEEKTTRKAKILTTTYTCPACQHTYKDKLDLNHKKEEPEDLNFEADRKHYCLQDEAFRKRLLETDSNLKGLADLMKDIKEKEDNKHIYDAVKELKKPKIAELVPLLSEPLEKAGYIEFHLDKPDMGREIRVGFRCLDSKSDRSDHDSRKTLKNLVDSTLKNTNWRLMSDGISYRLGYLSGRVRAFESEEELKILVMRDRKLKPQNESSKLNLTKVNAKNQWRIKSKDDEDIIL